MYQHGKINQVFGHVHTNEKYTAVNMTKIVVTGRPIISQKPKIAVHLWIVGVRNLIIVIVVPQSNWWHIVLIEAMVLVCDITALNNKDLIKNRYLQ